MAAQSCQLSARRAKESVSATRVCDGRILVRAALDILSGSWGADGYDARYASSICFQYRAPRHSECNFGRANAVALALTFRDAGYLALRPPGRAPQQPRQSRVVHSNEHRRRWSDRRAGEMDTA